MRICSLFHFFYFYFYFWCVHQTNPNPNPKPNPNACPTSKVNTYLLLAAAIAACTKIVWSDGVGERVEVVIVS